MLIESKLPHAIEAERGLIGAIILGRDPESLSDIADLPSDAFADAACSAAFVAIREIMEVGGTPTDVVAIKNRLDNGKFGENVNAWFGDVVNDCPPSRTAMTQCLRHVRDAHTRRLAIETAEEIRRNAADLKCTDYIEQAHAATASLVSCHSSPNSVPKLIGDGLGDLIAALEDGMASDQCVATGLPTLDAKLAGGFAPEQFVVIGARTGVGKTSMALGFALHAARQNRSVLLYSLEMSRRELQIRMLSMLSGVSYDGLARWDLDAATRKQVADAVAELDHLPIGIEDRPGHTPTAVSRQAREYRRKHGLDLLVVDYLQLMSSEDRRQVREQAVAAVSRSLKILASELRIPVVALSQLNRQAGDDTPPQLQHLRESGAIEQDASVVLLIHADEQKQVSLRVAKSRNGQCGIVPLTWHAPTFTFHE